MKKRANIFTPVAKRAAGIERLTIGGLLGFLILIGARVFAGQPSEKEYAANWPRFRGPGGAGVAAYVNMPAQWDGASNKGILWKTPIPLPGENSPIVWGNKIFLSGATSGKRFVYCLNADSGKILWAQPIQMPNGKKDEVPNVMDDTGYAASSMATDGLRVFAIFANGVIAGLDFDGNVLWSKNLGPLQIQYGYAASLVTYQGLVIVTLDVSTDENENAIVAFDGATGAEKWRTIRPAGNSWSTPAIAQTSVGPQIITTAAPFAIAYDPNSGKEIWRVDCLSGDVVPSPVFGGGLAFAVNAGAILAAIKPEGKGDVSATHISWKTDNGLPTIVSPLTDGKLIWLVTTSGTLTCYKVKDGTKAYEHELNGTLNASPTLVGNKIYILDSEGTMIIIDAADQFKELGRSKLGEPTTASPAFMDGRIYIRGKSNMYCIGPAK